MGVERNLVDQVWGPPGGSRPSHPSERIKPLPLEFAGKKWQEKVEDLRKELEKKNSAGLVVCMSDLVLANKL